MKKHFVLIIICAAVFIAAAVSSVVMLNVPAGDIVKIKRNLKVQDSFFCS